MALAVGVVAPRDPLAAVGLTLAAVLVAAVALRPRLGGLVLAGVVPLTSGLGPGFPIPHVRVSEALVGLVGVTVLVSVRPRDAVRWQAVEWWLLAYGVAWAVFGVVDAHSLRQHLQIADWGTVFGQLQFFLLYRAVRVALRTRADRRLALWVVLLSSALASLLAVLEELRLPGVGNFIATITGGLAIGAGTAGGAPTTVGGILRATGPFDNWAALAGYLLPVLLVLVALAMARRWGRPFRWFALAGVLGALAFVLTAEQSAIVCFVVGAVVLAKRFGARRVVPWMVLAVAVGAAILGPFLAERIASELGGGAGTGRMAWVPQTLSFRWSIWTGQYLPAIGARPFAGYGVILPPTIRWPYPESQYVSFLVEGGIPMVAAFFGTVGAVLAGTVRAARSADPVDRALGSAMTVAVVSMLVMNVMWPFLSNGGMPQVLWVLLALTVPQARRYRPAVGVGGLRWATAAPATAGRATAGGGTAGPATGVGRDEDIVGTSPPYGSVAAAWSTAVAGGTGVGGTGVGGSGVGGSGASRTGAGGDGHGDGQGARRW